MTLNTQDEVLEELVRARLAFPPMHSAHEGFARHRFTPLRRLPLARRTVGANAVGDGGRC